MHKTATKLADGRELVYYDREAGTLRDAADQRPLEPAVSFSETRLDPVLGDWVTVAAHRQGRTYHPPAGECPLCPSGDGRLSEIPAADYEVVVFENRFPSLAVASAGHVEGRDDALHSVRPGTGRCEVVCFTSDHDASFADLREPEARLVLEAWIDRTVELSALPEVQQVYCFENRGAEVGVTLAHPHGQIYAFPFVAPRTAKMIARADAHRARTGRNLFEDLLAAEYVAQERVVVSGEHWIAFVPFAARWPYEVHLYPTRRVPDLAALNEEERAEFPGLYLDLLRRFDRLFLTSEGEAPGPTPYIAAWHQAPKAGGRDLALHLELFTIRRAPGKIKYLAGVESGLDSFVTDVNPESAARRLRDAAR